MADIDFFDIAEDLLNDFHKLEDSQQKHLVLKAY